MTTPKTARPALALLALGTLAVGALSGCAPAQTAQPVQVLAEPSSPYAVRADAATLVYRSLTGRAGAVDVLLDGTPILRQVRPDVPYRVVVLPPGRRTLSVRNSLSGTVLEATTVDLQAGESYALGLNVDPTTREYVLILGRGGEAVYDLTGAS
ncbi:DUF4397 domain-containing protein [Deinococcus planocerae]|uniref:DUF4397 domain-containing protein n=1 Tax=Deinococcus planocerae TaxID=1737569 RepID=UPI000C7EE8D7|nr:DUF4397 domain-containing protein [Deinococcus planocerae]